MGRPFATLAPLTLNQQALVEQHVDLARRIAAKLTADSPWLQDEAESAALEALCRAAPRWDASRGVPFSGFARCRIAGAILDLIREALPVRRRRRGNDRTSILCRHSLEEIIALDDNNAPLTFGEVLPDGNSMPWRIVDDEDTFAVLLRFLPQRHRLVVRLIYAEGLTQEAAGQAIGCCKSRSCQIHGEAIEMLRKALARMGRTA